MTETGRLELAAFDARDTEKVAKFYCDLAGWEIGRDDGGWIIVKTTGGNEVGFQPSDNHIAPTWPTQEYPQQFHLDLTVDGIEAAADRAVELGATRLATGASWITLADPAGHPFDLCQRDGAEGTGLFAVTIDAPDAIALAHFYAGLLGMEITYEGPEGGLISGDGKSLMFQQVSDYNAPQWPDPAHPQQAHLDILVDDLDAVQARAVELGATVIKGESPQYRTLVDPAGHPFDITL